MDSWSHTTVGRGTGAKFRCSPSDDLQILRHVVVDNIVGLVRRNRSARTGAAPEQLCRQICNRYHQTGIASLRGRRERERLTANSTGKHARMVRTFCVEAVATGFNELCGVLRQESNVNIPLEDMIDAQLILLVRIQQNPACESSDQSSGLTS